MPPSEGNCFEKGGMLCLVAFVECILEDVEDRYPFKCPTSYIPGLPSGIVERKSKFLERQTENTTTRLSQGSEVTGKYSRPPKYKCPMAAGAKIRGNFDTTTGRFTEHKNKLWNWHRPFFRCACNNNDTKCGGQIVWFDYAVWYMLNHLDIFFSATSLQGRLIQLISFLSGDARRMVFDHIAFLHIHKLLVEAAMEQAKDPLARLLTSHGNERGIKTIEASIKPGSFSESAATKRKYNLNVVPTSEPYRKKGMFNNFTPARGRGRGYFDSPASVPRPGGARGTGHGQAAQDFSSPLQRRNIPF
ncbi:unnamed protein product [Calypogeia fissa]